MLSCAISVLLLASPLLQEPAPKPAQPQEAPPSPLQDGPQRDPAQEPAPPSSFEASLTLTPRVTRLAGDYVRSVSLQYEDLWSDGFGFAAELDVTGSVGGNWKLGGYLSLGADLYSGQNHDTGFGIVDMDDLLAGCGMLGFKARLSPDGGFYLDGRIGAGFVYWMETDGVLASTGSSVVVVESKVAPALEAAVHAGYSSRSTILALGLCVRNLGESEQNLIPMATKTGSAIATSLEFEIGFRF